ncbi:AAA family ATPase [Gordonia spumicola]|nr:AAA family ATPase [Gordonia spumicola]
MLVWINGAFGSGKTHTAHELHRRHGRGRVADPEILGYAMHKMLPRSARGDFQDLPQWRSGVADTLEQAAAANDGPVFVPMTVVRAQYFDETVGELRRRGTDVRHFTLAASRRTLEHRLSSRVSSMGARLLRRDETWAHAQIDRCRSALAAEAFGLHIDTDDRTLDDVVETIAAHLHLDLPKGRLSRPAAALRRVEVAVRHIRL